MNTNNSPIPQKNEKEIIQLLQNQELVRKIGLSNFEIAKLIRKLSKDVDKMKIMNQYELEQYLVVDIIKSFKDQLKEKLLKQEMKLCNSTKIDIISSFETDNIIRFIENQKEWLKENGIKPYEIIARLESQKQEEIVLELEEIELTTNEKREIIAVLNEDVKKEINKDKLPENYRNAIDVKVIKLVNNIKIELDQNLDLEKYRGLDNLMIVNAENFDEEERKTLIKISEICPNISITNQLGTKELKSTIQEYIEAEKWIKSVIDNIKPDYTDIQKAAIIDNEIGKKISYSPEIGTEIFDEEKSRALWKIICTGHGVCNGISAIEKYIFQRVGIKSEMVVSKTHAFLKVIDIEIPLINGQKVKGNTIIDPTWNLSAYRFGERPQNFCISYEQARKSDIIEKDNDTKAHENDEELKDATISIDRETLKKVFKSVGITRENGEFKFVAIKKASKILEEAYRNRPKQNIRRQLALLKRICPEFIECQRESIKFLYGILMNNSNLKAQNLQIDRVYEKTDQEKRPVMYIHVTSEEVGNIYYYADKENNDFTKVTEEEFAEKFEHYKEKTKNTIEQNRNGAER